MNDNKRHATRKSGPGSGVPKSARAGDPQQVRADELTSIASQHLERGRFIEALETVLQALAQRETPAAKAIFIGCFRHCRFSGDVPELRAVVARAVSQAWGRFDEFSAGATNLAKHGPQIAAAIARVTKAWPKRLNGDDLWTAAQRTAICSDPLLLALMEATTVADLDLERLLTNARFALLQHALTPAATGGVERHLLAFYCLVARQCFTNEYVFTATADEIAHVRQLQDSLLAALNSKANVPVLWLVAVAAYLPLHRAGANMAPLLQRHWPRVVSELLNQQISEPLEEARLRPTIRAITPIDTAVSLAVREQYEENPFPRWVKSPGQLVPRSVEEAMHILFPTATLQGVAGDDGCDILVAGCGTGHHAIECAQRFRGARVLAIDLSLASLSYAKRKTRELDMRNIDYAQADILKVESIQRKFDVIEAGGVLHHLEDPFAGWRALVSRLRPYGFMYVGLYSAFGRQRLIAARAFIAERGYRSTADDIRRFRQDLLASELAEPLRRYCRTMDFFNISGCRDLFFHVQEHRHDLVQIKDFLDDNGLDFLGFVLEPQELQRFYARFPGETVATNLDLWQIFEAENPDFFSSMYHMWLRKRASAPPVPALN